MRLLLQEFETQNLLLYFDSKDQWPSVYKKNKVLSMTTGLTLAHTRTQAHVLMPSSLACACIFSHSLFPLLLPI